MAKKGEKKVGRTLQLKFTLPTAEPDRLMALIKAAKPYYELFGGKQVRLLQNVDHPAHADATYQADELLLRHASVAQGEKMHRTIEGRVISVASGVISVDPRGNWG